jgi:hypothetical protein
MKKTAIEWLEEHLKGQYGIYIENLHVTDKARAMEKEQIKEAYNYGWDDRHHDVKKSWLEDADEKYYNETYGE